MSDAETHMLRIIVAKHETEIARLRNWQQEAVPMVQSYRRKHSRAFNAAEKRMHTEMMERHAERIGLCDRLLRGARV